MTEALKANSNQSAAEKLAFVKEEPSLVQTIPTILHPTDSIGGKIACRRALK